ncbi:hypothetical protein ILT44_24095 [Microvirga sp. BT689]|uniref:hypothetical protein n=1 Tax=Microvirga arvi TaxID=2778731 RepID=UPI0019501DC6|nr:hypothetical protein [Microvirga arvi]MBM6583287.1 hypothetical protein [Microvirga arvi]
MSNEISQISRRPSFIALAAVAALGWIVAIWSIGSSSRQEDYLNERIQQLEATHQVAVSQLEELRRTAGTAESLQSQISTARADLASLKQQQEKTVQALATIRSETEAADRRLQESRQAQAKVQQDLTAAREQLAALERRQAEMVRVVGEITVSRDRVMAELNEARERSAALQQQLAGIADQLASRRSELAALEEQRSARPSRDDTPRQTGSTLVNEGLANTGQQIYRCDDNESGWICSAEGVSAGDERLHQSVPYPRQ